MKSAWKDNKKLAKWIKKNQFNFVDGNFNFDLRNLKSDPLLCSISKYINIKKDYIYVGNGISQFISVVLNLKDWTSIYLFAPEFDLYRRTAYLSGKKVIEIKGMTCSEIIENMMGIQSGENDLLCFSSPRWFSGETFSHEQIKKLLDLFHGCIMIDEAYVDYSNEPNGLIDLCLSNDRLILVRSFSKKFFASGMRVGYLITKRDINGLRETLISPHSVSTYSANFFIKLLSDEKLLNIFKNTAEYVKFNRDYIYNSLIECEKVKIIKSNSNFITLIFSSEQQLNDVYKKLSKFPGIQKFSDNYNYLKIWISDFNFSKLVVKTLKDIL